jgi:hypothetical protein
MGQAPVLCYGSADFYQKNHKEVGKTEIFKVYAFIIRSVDFINTFILY